MRSPALAIVLACLCLTGCTSRSSVDALQIAPSTETTSSIVRPDAAVGVTVAHADAGMAALAETGQPTEALEQVAMLVPSVRPASRRGTIYAEKFRDAHPIDFGRITPQHHAVHGVDVSRWQGEIDWERLRGQGANFAFIKATDGADHIDPMFMKNWNGADAAGIRRGAYHFFYWCSYASAQADWFIRNVPKVEGALPPVLDVEWNHQSDCRQRLPRAKVLDKMQVFLDRLEQHYGQRPIIYTSPDFYDANLKGAFPNHPFWLRSVAAHPAEVYPGRDWVFWQYSGSGLSKGVDGRIDLNVFHGDEAAWWRWLGKAAG
jgi:lysozyme